FGNCARLIGFGLATFTSYHTGTFLFVVIAIVYALAALCFHLLPRDDHMLQRRTPSRIRVARTRGNAFLRDLIYAGRYLRRALDMRILAVSAVSAVGIGVSEVITLPYAIGVLGVADEWTGSFSALALLAALFGGLLLSKNSHFLSNGTLPSVVVPAALLVI